MHSNYIRQRNIKNVIHRYMTSADSKKIQHLLKKKTKKTYKTLNLVVTNNISP